MLLHQSRERDNLSGGRAMRAESVLSAMPEGKTTVVTETETVIEVTTVMAETVTEMAEMVIAEMVTEIVIAGMTVETTAEMTAAAGMTGRRSSRTLLRCQPFLGVSWQPWPVENPTLMPQCSGNCGLQTIHTVAIRKTDLEKLVHRLTGKSSERSLSGSVGEARAVAQREQEKRKDFSPTSHPIA